MKAFLLVLDKLCGKFIGDYMTTLEYLTNGLDLSTAQYEAIMKLADVCGMKSLLEGRADRAKALATQRNDINAQIEQKKALKDNKAENVLDELTTTEPDANEVNAEDRLTNNYILQTMRDPANRYKYELALRKFREENGRNPTPSDMASINFDNTRGDYDWFDAAPPASDDVFNHFGALSQYGSPYEDRNFDDSVNIDFDTESLMSTDPETPDDNAGASTDNMNDSALMEFISVLGRLCGLSSDITKRLMTDAALAQNDFQQVKAAAAQRDGNESVVADTSKSTMSLSSDYVNCMQAVDTVTDKLAAYVSRIVHVGTPTKKRILSKAIKRFAKDDPSNMYLPAVQGAFVEHSNTDEQNASIKSFYANKNNQDAQAALNMLLGMPENSVPSKPSSDQIKDIKRNVLANRTANTVMESMSEFDDGQFVDNDINDGTAEDMMSSDPYGDDVTGQIELAVRIVKYLGELSHADPFMIKRMMSNTAEAIQNNIDVSNEVDAAPELSDDGETFDSVGGDAGEFGRAAAEMVSDLCNNINMQGALSAADRVKFNKTKKLIDQYVQAYPTDEFADAFNELFDSESRIALAQDR